MVTSTVNWRIVDVEIAATMAAETMAVSGRAGDVSADITKLRQDVLKQAIASLAGFVGGVNYSNTFHMSASNQASNAAQRNSVVSATPALATSVLSTDKSALNKPKARASSTAEFMDNPLYDPDKMIGAVEHANRVTRTYGVEVNCQLIWILLEC
jgi:hypothetical protein